MSVSKWAYTPEMCDGGGCPGDCDLCDKPKNMEDEDDMTDYIKREDAIRAFNGSCSTVDADDILRHLHKGIDVIKNIPSADVVERSSYESMEHTVAKLNEALSNSVEVVRCKDCKYRKKNTFCLHNMRYEDDNGFCYYGEMGRYER